MLQAERQEQILEILREDLTIRGSRLSRLLGVSEMTIRRDLDILEQQGLLERTHGGAILRQARFSDKFKYNISTRENPRVKRRIAAIAATLIEPDDTIYIGEGFTVAQIVRYVKPNLHFTIFTNNLGVVSEMKDTAAELVLLAGTYNPATHALAGPLTMEMIRQVNATKVFLGADSLSLSAGLTTANLDIAVVERSMIRQTSGNVIVIADHSKFGNVAEISIAPLNHIDMVITDREIPSDFLKEFESMGGQIIVA
jgi:DeoR/GlpR family transcriptional regulator of sugar metabolism